MKAIERVQPRDVMLGKDGSKWRHGYVPLNAVAVAMKLHHHSGGTSTLDRYKGKQRFGVGVLPPHTTRTKHAAPANRTSRADAARVAAEQGRISVRRADAIAAGAKPAERVNAAPTASGLRIEHTPEGTLVHGTKRGGPEVPALKAAGFKYSRNLDAWYLPRTWHQGTRSNRVRQLETLLTARGIEHHTEASYGERLSGDALAEQRKAAAERSVERNTRRAEAAQAESDRQYEKVRQIGDAIPFGQPILVGHHSERRARRDQERMHTGMGRSIAAADEARAAQQRAESAKARAEGYDSQVAVARRLARNEAELRRLNRIIHGTGKAIHGQDQPIAPGAYRDRLTAEANALQADIDRDRKVQATHGGTAFGKHNISAGDVVYVGQRPYKVYKVNRTTITPVLGNNGGRDIPMGSYRVPFDQITRRVRGGSKS